MSTIFVLVKHVPDTWSTKTLNPDFTLHREGVDEVIDEINEYAVEQALRLKESLGESTVVALSMGAPSSEEALRKALAMGADHAVLLSDPALAGSDALGTVWALNCAIDAAAQTFGAPDVIIAGNASSDGSMGVVPGVLSEYRQVPALTNVREISVDGGVIKAVREDHSGTYQLSAPMPLVISVTEKNDKPRFPNFKGIMAAKKAEIVRLSLADTAAEAVQVGLANAATVVTAAANRPERSGGRIVRGEQGVEELVAFLKDRI